MTGKKRCGGKWSIILQSNSDWCCLRKNDKKFLAHCRCWENERMQTNTTLIAWVTSPFIRTDKYSDDLFDRSTLLYFLCFKELRTVVLTTVMEASGVLILRVSRQKNPHLTRICLLCLKHPDMLYYSLWCPHILRIYFFHCYGFWAYDRKCLIHVYFRANKKKFN